MTEEEHGKFQSQTGIEMKTVIKNLLNVHDPDKIEELSQNILQKDKGLSKENAIAEAKESLLSIARKPFSSSLNDLVETIRRDHEQIVDTVNLDSVISSGWDKEKVVNAEILVHDFRMYMELNKEEIAALRIFYNTPYERRKVTYAMLKDVLNKLKTDKPGLAPLRVWNAFEQIEKVKDHPKNELIALVSLIRRIMGIDQVLTTFDKSVDQNFQKWIFGKHAGKPKFSEEQMHWLRMIKEHISMSFHIDTDDLDYTPFDSLGGRGKMYQLFGEGMEDLIEELNTVLAA